MSARKNPTAPRAVVEWLAANGVTNKQLAGLPGFGRHPVVVCDVLAGRRGLTVERLQSLHYFLGVPWEILIPPPNVEIRGSGAEAPDEASVAVPLSPASQG